MYGKDPATRPRSEVSMGKRVLIHLENDMLETTLRL